MGHSFFRPAALDLLNLIPDTNVVNHTESIIVMSGGPGGSPLMLWQREDKREAGLNYLNRGDVDLFVMTYYSPENSSIEHYSRWFDHAISKNPSITLMMAIPWQTQLGSAPASQIAKAEVFYEQVFNELVVPLRKKYSKNKIIFCPYGLNVYELIRRLNSGDLPGVKYIVNPDRKNGAKNIAILKDPLGHGSDLVTKLNALVWLQTIYKIDLSHIQKKYRVDGLPDIDLK